MLGVVTSPEVIRFLSTPPSRVATAVELVKLAKQLKVSIHATLAGGDGVFFEVLDKIYQFLSTPPSRVATSKTPAQS